MQFAMAAVSTFVEKFDGWARQTRLLVSCLHLHASATPTASHLVQFTSFVLLLVN